MLSAAATLMRAEERAALVRSASLLKRNALAAPFERAFAMQKQIEANPPPADEPARAAEIMAVHYRCVRPAFRLADDSTVRPRPSTSRPARIASLSSSAPSSTRRRIASSAASSCRRVGAHTIPLTVRRSSSMRDGNPRSRARRRSCTRTASRRSRSDICPGSAAPRRSAM